MLLRNEPQVQTLAIHLPVLCVEMCDWQYSSGSKFTLSTTKQYRTARLKHDDKYIVYRLHDLQNFESSKLRILYLAPEQQKVFPEALPDILDFVGPVTANKNIQYKHLFDVLKSTSI
jgi:hypothetical protein